MEARGPARGTFLQAASIGPSGGESPIGHGKGVRGDSQGVWGGHAAPVWLSLGAIGDNPSPKMAIALRNVESLALACG